MYIGTLPQVIHEGYELKDFGRKVVDGVKYVGKGAYKIGGGLVGAATGAAAGAGIGAATGAAAGSMAGKKLLSVPGAAIGGAAGIPLGALGGAFSGMKYGARTGYALAGKQVGEKINNRTRDDYTKNKYNITKPVLKNPKGGIVQQLQDELYFKKKNSGFFGKQLKNTPKNRLKAYDQEWTLVI